MQLVQAALSVCGRKCLERGHFVDPLMDRLLLNNVLLNNRLDFVDGYVCVPNSIRPNHENRASFANSQAVDFAPQHNSLWTICLFKAQLTDHPFEFIPGRDSCRRIAALHFGWGGAKQQMMADRGLHCRRINHAAMDTAGIRRVPRFTCSRTD